jgi:glutathionyl-hydroquinone reductase
MLNWVRTLKSINGILLNDEIIPLRQDCKTLTIVNNVRSILEEVNGDSEFESHIDDLIESPRELQDYLQDICQKVFSAINIGTE